MRTFVDLTAIVFILYVSCQLTGINAAGPKYKRYAANLKADLLVLDVGGMRSLGNHPLPFEAIVGSPAGCQFFCDRLPGCNGWTFCNRTEGCGSGCRSYQQQNPTPGGYTGTGFIDPNTKLPIKWFGPLSGSRKCDGDKWAWGVCSLKKVKNPSKPQFFSKNAADGWVSGVVLLPAECAGVSAGTCTACKASKDPAACLACAKPASKLQSAIWDAITGLAYNPTWTEGCTVCAALTDPQKRTVCNSCMASGAPCGQCTGESLRRQREPTPQPLDVTTCLDCAVKPPFVYDECAACAGLGAGTKRTGCLGCVAKLGNVLKLDPNGPSKYRIARGNFCATCFQASASIAKQCVKCGGATPNNEDCYECASYSVKPKARAACYQCANKVKLGNNAEQNTAAGGAAACAGCLGDGIPTIPAERKPLCKACLYDPTVSYGGKYWCNTCVERLDDPAARTRCIDCLKSKKITNYFGDCVQANYP